MCLPHFKLFLIFLMRGFKCFVRCYQDIKCYKMWLSSNLSAAETGWTIFLLFLSGDTDPPDNLEKICNCDQNLPACVIACVPACSRRSPECYQFALEATEGQSQEQRGLWAA